MRNIILIVAGIAGGVQAGMLANVPVGLPGIAGGSFLLPANSSGLNDIFRTTPAANPSIRTDASDWSDWRFQAGLFDMTLVGIGTGGRDRMQGSVQSGSWTGGPIQSNRGGIGPSNSSIYRGNAIADNQTRGAAPSTIQSDESAQESGARYTSRQSDFSTGGWHPHEAGSDGYVSNPPRRDGDTWFDLSMMASMILPFWAKPVKTYGASRAYLPMQSSGSKYDVGVPMRADSIGMSYLVPSAGGTGTCPNMSSVIDADGCVSSIASRLNNVPRITGWGDEYANGYVVPAAYNFDWYYYNYYYGELSGPVSGYCPSQGQCEAVGGDTVTRTPWEEWATATMIQVLNNRIVIYNYDCYYDDIQEMLSSDSAVLASGTVISVEKMGSRNLKFHALVQYQSQEPYYQSAEIVYPGQSGQVYNVSIFIARDSQHNVQYATMSHDPEGLPQCGIVPYCLHRSGCDTIAYNSMCASDASDTDDLGNASESTTIGSSSDGVKAWASGVIGACSTAIATGLGVVMYCACRRARGAGRPATGDVVMMSMD
jgi:hypothetical protein